MKKFKFFNLSKKPFTSPKTIGWPPLIICGPSGSGKVTS
jgi:hypothetical protein